MIRWLLALAASAALVSGAAAQSGEMRLAVTTSFQNSGLADHLLPEIASDLGLEVQLLVVGTGQALRLGEAGDVDAVLVHDREAEEEFVSEGHGTHRREIMYNDFVLVGPSADPAGVKSAEGAVDAMQEIARAQAPFVSRGDDSGTHRRELSLWQDAGVDTDTAGGWYRAAGAGMGTTLNVAAGMDGYTLTDRATWLSFENKRGLELVFEGDPRLFNQYAYLPVNPERHPHVEHDLARALEDWLTSGKGQAMIAGHTLRGERLFVPNAVPQGDG